MLLGSAALFSLIFLRDLERLVLCLGTEQALEVSPVLVVLLVVLLYSLSGVHLSGCLFQVAFPVTTGGFITLRFKKINNNIVDICVQPSTQTNTCQYRCQAIG